MLEKKCNRCNTIKPASEFYKNHRTKTGLFYTCISCCNLLDKERTSKNPFPKQITQFNRNLKKSGHSTSITLDHFTRLLETQDSKCKICKDRLLQPHIDHDHTSGKIRSLICHHCNILIGMSRENTSILNSAIEYLEHHRLQS
jgi:hypothetical protein